MQVFELLAQHKEQFSGATFANQDGSLYDVGKALKKGGGRIATDDPYVIDRLRELGVFKESSSTAGRKPRSRRRSSASTTTTTTAAAGTTGGEGTEA
jgi:hypothetical protein